MDWRDEGAILAVRRHGESSAIIDVFTAKHGRHAGVVRGGTSRKMTPILQPGAQVDVTWRARLEEHLGSYTVEPLRTRASGTMGDRLSLAGLNAVCALLVFCLPEREAHAPLYDRTITLMDLINSSDAWPLAYLKWELALLDEMGFGLDLTKCAATGARDDLIYVSPKSGCAVSRTGAGEWADRMLPLPQCFLGQGPVSDQDIRDGLFTTGYFLLHRLAAALHKDGLPPARQRLIDLLNRQAEG